jgi:hypothetical protein
MLNVDCSGNCVSLISRWHYYVVIDVNGDKKKNRIKWILNNLDKKKRVIIETCMLYNMIKLCLSSIGIYVD